MLRFGARFECVTPAICPCQAVEIFSLGYFAFFLVLLRQTQSLVLHGLHFLFVVGIIEIEIVLSIVQVSVYVFLEQRIATSLGTFAYFFADRVLFDQIKPVPCIAQLIKRHFVCGKRFFFVSKCEVNIFCGQLA